MWPPLDQHTTNDVAPFVITAVVNMRIENIEGFLPEDDELVGV